MPFSPVPEASKKQIDRSGKTLVSADPHSAAYKEALSLAESWRACHAYPINTFQATLRNRTKSFGRQRLVAQRLKRMPTIIDKLRRYPNMKLTTMQDIGGLRVVLNSAADVSSFVKDFKTSTFQHILVDEKDYISEPRSEDGYRSHHLIYKYENMRAPDYSGLRLELQVRSKLQHTWATAVETMGTFLGQALKSRQGDQGWLDFFALVSTAFAQREKSPRVPRYAGLSARQITRAIVEMEMDLDVLEKMRGFSAAVDALSKNSDKKEDYHLMILDSFNHHVEVYGFDKNSLDQAIEAYSEAEARAARGAPIEPVLVSAGPLSRLRRAYPNFFLDISAFSTEVERMTAGVRPRIRRNRQQLQLPLEWRTRK